MAKTGFTFLMLLQAFLNYVPIAVSAHKAFSYLSLFTFYTTVKGNAVINKLKLLCKLRLFFVIRKYICKDEGLGSAVVLEKLLQGWENAVFAIRISAGLDTWGVVGVEHHTAR